MRFHLYLIFRQVKDGGLNEFLDIAFLSGAL